MDCDSCSQRFLNQKEMANETLKNFYIRYNTTADLKGTRQVKGELKDVADQSKKTGRSFKGFAKIGPVAVTAILAVGAAAVAVAAKFGKLASEADKSRQQMIGLAGLSERAAGVLDKRAMSLAAKYAQDVGAVGNAFLDVSSAGIRGAEAIEIVDGAAKAALVGLGDTDQIVQFLTKSLETFKNDGLTAAEVLDTLTGAARAANARADDLIKVLPLLSPYARTLGIDLKELAGVTASLTRTMPDVSKLRVSLEQMFLSFSREGTRKALIDIGIPVQEFMDLVRVDLVSALEVVDTKLLETFGDRKDERYTGALAKIFRSGDAQIAYLNLINDLDSTREVTNEVIDSQGKLDEAMESVRFGTVELGNQFGNLQTKLGALFLPTIHSLTETMGDMVTFLNENDEAIINLATTFNDVLAPIMRSVLELFQNTVKEVNFLVSALQRQGFLKMPNAPVKTEAELQSEQNERNAEYTLNQIREATKGMTKSEAQAWLQTPRGRALKSQYNKWTRTSRTEAKESLTPTTTTPTAPVVTSTARPTRAPITFTGTGSVGLRSAQAFDLGESTIPSQLQGLPEFQGIVLAAREAEFMAEALSKSTEALLNFGDELAGILSNVGLGGAGRALSSVTGAFDTARSVGGAFKAAQNAVASQGGVSGIVNNALSSAGPLGIIAGGVTLIGGLFKTFSRRSEKRAQRRLEEQRRQTQLLSASLNPYKSLRGQSLGDIGKYWTGGGFNSRIIRGGNAPSTFGSVGLEKHLREIGILDVGDYGISTSVPSMGAVSNKVEAPVSITVNAAPGMDEAAVAREVQSRLTQQFRQTVADFG